MKAFDVDYHEGAAVGYKWYDRQGLDPLFAFGHGLSYTRFEYSGLTAKAAANRVTVSFTVRNIGDRAGAAVPQIYVEPRAGGWEAPKRLGGWSKLTLNPGEERQATVTIAPRLLATYDSAGRRWRILPGEYQISLAASSRDIKQQTQLRLAGGHMAAGSRPITDK